MGILGAIFGGVVGFMVGGPAGAVIGAGLGATSVGEKVVNKVLDFVTQPFMSMFGAPGAGDSGSEAAKQQGVLLQRNGGNETIPIIYGFRAVGGTIVYAETGGPSTAKPANKYLWVAYVMCEGPVEGLKELHIDDHQFPESVCASLNAGETVSITGLKQDVDQAWKYNDKVTFRWFPGKYYNTPSSSPIASQAKVGIFKDAPNFSDDMVFNGVAVLLARYEKKEYTSQDDANNDPFGGGVPVIRAGIMGRKVVGVATTMYSGNQIDYANSATLLTNVNSYWSNNTAYDVNGGRYSTNPVECLFDYLRNPRYGKGLLLTDLDKDSWIKAANKCNQRVTYYTGAMGPILTCNYVVDTGQTLMQNTKAILSGFRAYMPYIQGKYKVKIEDAGNDTDILSGVASIVQTVTKDDIVGDVLFTGIERSDKYNQVVVTYVDPDQKWSNQQEVWPVTEAERLTYIAEDNGRENKKDLTIGSITNSIMARDMARLIFNKSRYQETCSFKMAARGFELEPGDNIYIQSNILNFGEVPWRVISTRLNNDYTFEVGCVRNPDTIYPYGRYNEPDIVRPTYVPRQNEIYLPRVNSPLLGIFPPSYAPMPINWTGNLAPGNLGPTFPADTGSISNPGGGAYDATNGGTAVTGNTGKTPLVVQTINDYITFTGAKYDSASKSWTVTFSPPNTANYAGVKFWWRQQGVTTYINGPEVAAGTNSVVVQGASTNILNVLAYELVGRVKYTNGDYSTAATKVVLSTDYSGLGMSTIFTFGSTNITVQDANFTNVDADPHLIYVKNTSGVSSPKTLEFKITERPSTGAYGSTNIAAILVYYRPEGGSATALTKPYWAMKPFNLPTTYTAYDEFTFTTEKLFGTTTEARYDLIFKFKFKNGAIGSKQVRVRGLIIRDDDSGASYQFSEAAEEMKEAPSIATTNSTAKLAVTSIIGDGTEMTVSFWNPTQTINGVPPSITNWAGVTVEVAKLVPGYVIEYKTIVDKQIGQLGHTFDESEYWVDVPLPNSTSLANYAVIVRATFYDAGGALQYSSFARKWVGAFRGSYTDGNQIASTRLVEQNAPGTLYTTQKGLPTDTYGGQAADKKVIIPSALKNWNIPNPTVGALSTKAPPYVPTYQISFAAPAGVTFNKVRIYRRVNSYPYNLTRFEWTDITSTGQTNFRYAAYDGETTGDYYNFVYDTKRISSSGAPNPVAYECSSSNQEIFIKFFYNGIASKAVLRVIPTNGTSSDGELYTFTNAMPTSFNAVENIYDLDELSNQLLKDQLAAADLRPASEARHVWYTFSDSTVTYAPGQAGYQGPFK